MKEQSAQSCFIYQSIIRDGLIFYCVGNNPGRQSSSVSTTLHC